MGNNREKETIWVRLKRVFRKIGARQQPGDGGAYTDKYLPITKPQQDTTLIQNDTIVPILRNSRN